MTAGYAAFVNGGQRVGPTLIDSVQDRRGRVVFRADRRTCATCRAAVWAVTPERSTRSAAR